MNFIKDSYNWDDTSYDRLTNPLPSSSQQNHITMDEIKKVMGENLL